MSVEKHFTTNVTKLTTESTHRIGFQRRISGLKYMGRQSKVNRAFNFWKRTQMQPFVLSDDLDKIAILSAGLNKSQRVELFCRQQEYFIETLNSIDKDQAIDIAEKLSVAIRYRHDIPEAIRFRYITQYNAFLQETQGDWILVTRR